MVQKIAVDNWLRHCFCKLKMKTINIFKTIYYGEKYFQ